MFNFAIFKKTLRDSAISILLSAIGIVAFLILFVWAMLNMGTDLIEFLSKIPFLTKIFEMGFGIRLDGEVSINILFAICFTHAVVLALTWTMIISTVTRTTVGELERGTADLLLSLPVSRSEVFFSTSVVWWLAAALLSYCPILGIWIGTQIFETKEAVEITRYVAPATNFLMLNLTVGCLATLVSCLLDRRGVAVGTTVAVLLSSAVLNFIEPFIDAIRHIRFLGLLNYFRPVDVVRTGEWPIAHMVVLFALAFCCWIIGLIVFSRRDIPTA